MNRFIAIAMLVWLSISLPAFAATDAVSIDYLPMQEAADAVRTQLSDSGKVAVIASQRLLIIDDDSTHISKAKALLKRIDRVPGQYTAYLNIEDISANASRSAQASGQVRMGELSGGWLTLQLKKRKSQTNHRQSFQLRTSSNLPGSIETGTLQSFNRTTRLWLSGYGVISANSVEMIPLTSGFHITVSPAGMDQVRVSIVPWMKRLQANVQGQQEMLIDLGTNNAPTMTPGNNANMRLNARPIINEQPVIELIGAATELVIPVDQSVTIAAANREAEKLGSALLSRFSTIGKRQFVMHLRVTKE